MPPSKEVLIARLKAASREYRVDMALEQYENYRKDILSGLPDLIDGRVVVNIDIETAYAEVERILTSLS